MIRLVAATMNPGKMRELRRLLGALPVRIEGLDEHPGVALPPEDGATYAENALRKARAATGALGLPALGDDSGLEVDLLGGAPGLHTARFAGPGASSAANIARLLALLEGARDEERTARFRALIALAWPAPAAGGGGWTEALFEGVWEGRIARAPAGAGGFGYDPVFLVPGLGATAAQLDDARKDALSHRAQAAAKLAAWVRGNLPPGAGGAIVGAIVG